MISLNKKNVAVWYFDINNYYNQIDTFTSICCLDEIKRSEKFKFDEHRKRFLVAHGLLRLIISKYLNINPSILLFKKGLHEKPELIQNNNQNNNGKLCFNMSHSKDMVAYAITCNRQIGIDIEFIELEKEITDLAKRFFFPSENKLLNDKASKNQKNIMFYNIWTLKEAYLKATGEGLSGLEKTEIAIDKNLQPTVKNAKSTFNVVKDISLKNLDILPNYAIGIAVEGSSWKLNCFNSNDLEV